MFYGAGGGPGSQRAAVPETADVISGYYRRRDDLVTYKAVKPAGNPRIPQKILVLAI